MDLGCIKTVCGEAWLQHFLQSLSYEECKQVTVFEGKNMFKFGDNKMVKSLRKIQFPVNTAGFLTAIATDVVAYDIPLLLSKESMKKANAKIDFQRH